MSNLTLDGGTRFIGTEFIKLLATGSSPLATEEYVDDAIAQGGGGGAIDAYTKTETDALLNNKLNVNNPQDIIGTLRIDSTNGNGKLIVNAVGAPNDEDFYVNGLSNLGGTLKCQLLQASSNIETSQLIRSDTLNSYSNTDMKIQRNSIDYIVLESDKVNFKRDIYVNDVLLTGGGSGNPFDENVVINNPYELQCNTFNNSVLNQDMVFNINGGEWFRLQFSDNTVRVPNTKSFLSQNIFSDIIKPLAFANDISLQGKNTTSDGYEEYVKINSTTETVDFNKNVNFNSDIDVSENIVMLPNKILYLDEGTTNKRYIRSSARSSPSVQNHLDIVQENTSIGRIRLMIGSEENVIVENTQLYSKRAITAVAGVKSNTYNSNGNNNVVFQRDGTTKLELNTNEVSYSTDLQMNTNKLEFNGDNIYLKYSVGVDSSDILDFVNISLTTPRVRYFVGGVSATDIIMQLYTDKIDCQRNIELGTAYQLKCNTINTNGDNDLVFKRNDVQYLALDKFTEDTVEREAIICSKQLRANANILVSNLQINQFPVGVEYADFRLENADSVMRFYAGNSTSVNLQLTNTGITLGRISTFTAGLKTNSIDTYTDTDLIFRRNGTEFFRLKTTNSIEVADTVFIYTPRVYTDLIACKTLGTDTVFYGSNTASNQAVEYFRFNYLSESVDFVKPIKTNTVNSNGDNDLVFQRNGVEYFRLDDLTGTDILNVANDKGVSASYVFGNRFWNRSFSSDTTFFGSNVAGDDRVEYMKWNYLSQSVDYNAPIDNTGLAITGNIIDTTVSDERLKTNIEDVDTDFTSCIKNVKVKTFKYKDDKYKTNDTYGFIAQDLLANLPKECKNIVKENKVKNEDETFLSINYMKLSVVLWKCCQEQQSKIEHLEASMYEMMEDIKELKGKKTTKPKAKAKSKVKDEK